MIKYFTGFLLLILIAWGSYWMAKEGFYPAAIVNQKIILDKSLDVAFQSSLAYYNKIKNPEVDQLVFEKEIYRASLDKLVENILIMEEVNVTEVENQLASLLQQNPNLEQGSVIAYGIAWDDFKRLILLPQIALEIIQKNLQADNNKDINEWMGKKKKSASVWIFTNNLSWNGEQIVVK